MSTDRTRDSHGAFVLFEDKKAPAPVSLPA
jgi:hypothetical protein